MWVTFSPDHSDTGGWHSFLQPAASASYIQDLITGDEKSDPIKIGDFIEMQNGVAESTINEMRKEFYTTHHGDWTVILPVIPGAQTYNQQREVLGFVAFEVIDVNNKDKSVSGWIRGGYICPGADTGSPSGGSGLALRASLPKLVQ
jgi:hypothetical protein